MDVNTFFGLVLVMFYLCFGLLFINMLMCSQHSPVLCVYLHFTLVRILYLSFIILPGTFILFLLLFLLIVFFIF